MVLNRLTTGVSQNSDHFSPSRWRQHAQALLDKPDYRTLDLRSQFDPEPVEQFLNRQLLKLPFGIVIQMITEELSKSQRLLICSVSLSFFHFAKSASNPLRKSCSTIFEDCWWIEGNHRFCDLLAQTSSHPSLPRPAKFFTKQLNSHFHLGNGFQNLTKDFVFKSNCSLSFCKIRKVRCDINQIAMFAKKFLCKGVHGTDGSVW